jgi:hypothetical protein
MMGQQGGSQDKLFYAFNLDDTRPAQRSASVQDPSRARHQGRHRHLPVEPKRLQDLLDEGQMLPQYTDPQGRAQHLRDLTRRCPLDRDHSAVRAIQA